LLNGAVWGQCDSIYSAFVVGSIYYIFKKKQFLSVLFLGLALAFKIQAIFILPLFFVLLLHGKIKWYYFLTIPFIYFLSVIPTWLYGRALLELLTIYFSQSNYYEMLTIFFPNIYIWMGDDYYQLIKKLGFIFTFLFTLVFGIWISRKKYHFTYEMWIKLAFLSVIITPYLLPGMHERYLYLGDVLAVLYFFFFPKKVGISLGIVFVSFYSYISCSRFKEFLPLWPAFFIYSGIIFLVVKDFGASLNDSKSQVLK
jgi:Gpi18-like mannosyltransferase